MLRSACHLKHFFLLEHYRIQFIRFEFVWVFAITEHIVLAHAPRVDLIFVFNYSISIVASWSHAGDFLLLFIIFHVILESKVPQKLVSSGSSKVADGTKVFLFSVLSLFYWLATLYSLPRCLSSLFLYLLLIGWLFLTFILNSISLTFFFFFRFRLFLSFQSFFLLLQLFGSLFLLFL